MCSCGVKRFFSTMWTYVTVCFKKYFDFKGRARRSEYWYFMLFTWLIGDLFSLAYALSDMYFIEVLSHLFAVLILIPTLAVAFRRIHDIGYSGIYVLLGYVIVLLGGLASTALIANVFGVYFRLLGYILLAFSLAIVLAYFYFFTRDSQPGKNKWGTNPKESK